MIAQQANHAFGTGSLGEVVIPPPPPPPVPPFTDVFNELEGTYILEAGQTLVQLKTEIEGYDRVEVTNLNNSGAGSLREALSIGERYIYFTPELAGTINLTSAISIPSKIVIDGRGANIRITRTSGGGVHAFSFPSGRSHLFLLYLRFANINNNIDSDAINLTNSNVIWVHHCSFEGGISDGIIDYVPNNTNSNKYMAVTECRIVSHVKTFNWGSGDQHTFTDGQGTWHRGRFLHATLRGNYDQSNERHPFVRGGRIHSYNNGYRYSQVGVQVRFAAQYRTERDIWTATSTPKRAGNDTGPSGWRSSHTAVDVLLENGAHLNDVFATGFNPESTTVNQLVVPYTYSAVTANQALKDALVENSGWQAVAPPEFS